MKSSFLTFSKDTNPMNVQNESPDIWGRSVDLIKQNVGNVDGLISYENDRMKQSYGLKMLLNFCFTIVNPPSSFFSASTFIPSANF